MCSCVPEQVCVCVCVCVCMVCIFLVLCLSIIHVFESNYVSNLRIECKWKVEKSILNFCQDYRNIYFLWRGQSQEKWVSLSILGGGGIQKVRLLEISNFRPPLPLFCPCLLYMYPVPPSTYVYFSKFSRPHTHTPSQQNIRDVYGFSNEKSESEKAEKNFFFLWTQQKRLIFFTQLYVQLQ